MLIASLVSVGLVVLCVANVLTVIPTLVKVYAPITQTNGKLPIDQATVNQAVEFLAE